MSALSILSAATELKLCSLASSVKCFRSRKKDVLIPPPEPSSVHLMRVGSLCEILFSGN